MQTLGGKVDIELRQKLTEELKAKETQNLNKKTIDAVNRIKAKLMGNDFKNKSNLEPGEQVRALIQQATSDENIAQAYIGWNPFL